MADDIDLRIKGKLMTGHQVDTVEMAGTIGHSKTGIPLHASLNQGDYAMAIYGEWQRTSDGQNHYNGQPYPRMNNDLLTLENYLKKQGAAPTITWRH
ncbi:MAG: hypothetical protein GY778_27935 [bacterium]|nr:hypothetical protein [bacterium]